MENLPLEVQTHIFDYLVGDCVHWTNEYSDVVVSDMNRINMYRASDYIDMFIFNSLEYHL